MKFVLFNKLMNVVFNSNLTRSPRGMRFVMLKSMLKYLGPLNSFLGKSPNSPGAGVPSKPGFNVELSNLPVVGSVVIFNNSGLTKNMPAGVL